MHSIITRPHIDTVVDAKFGNNELCTVSLDGTYKIWHFINGNNISTNLRCLVCQICR